LYNNPKSEYVASFFNEINEVPSNIIDKSSKSKNPLLLYPNQIKIIENSELKATVITSYFKGEYYLIEANLNERIIFIENSFRLQEGSTIYLEIVTTNNC